VVLRLQAGEQAIHQLHLAALLHQHVCRRVVHLSGVGAGQQVRVVADLQQAGRGRADSLCKALLLPYGIVPIAAPRHIQGWIKTP
jgi:hypothetical protein